MEKYQRISIGKTNQKMYPVSDGAILQSIIDKNPDQDIYESIYKYDKTHYEQYTKNKSAAGLTGLTTNKLVFDLDHATNLGQAKQETLDLYNRLLVEGFDQKSIQIYFSGKKGFHLVIDTKENLTNKQVKHLVKALAGDLETLDQKIFDEQRLIRVPITKHVETGLYKIPLTPKALKTLSVEQIKAKARLASDADFDEAIELYNAYKFDAAMPQKIMEVAKEALIEKPVVNNVETVRKDGPDFSKKPRFLSSVKYALQEGFFEPGERNDAFMILASTYRGLGYNKEIAYSTLKGVDRLHCSRFEDRKLFDRTELWKNIIEFIYSNRWKGGTYSEKENALLLKTQARYNIRKEGAGELKENMSITEIHEYFEKFADGMDQNLIKLGIPDLDDEVVFTSGMMVSFLGAPSSGKSSHVLNTLEYLASSGQKCYMGSFDMHTNLLYVRLIQKYYRKDMRTILEMMKNRSKDKKFLEALEQVKQTFGNVDFSFQGSVTIEDIHNDLKKFQDKHGVTPRVSVFDYNEKIQGPFSDATANSNYVAGHIADICKQYETLGILLVQPPKSAGDPSDPLLSMRQIKGSSRIEQDSRVILSTFRPGFSPDNNSLDKYSSIAVLKNNMGSINRFNFMFDGMSGRIRSMTEEEKIQYEEDLVTIAERKAAKELAKLNKWKK